MIVATTTSQWLEREVAAFGDWPYRREFVWRPRFVSVLDACRWERPIIKYEFIIAKSLDADICGFPRVHATFDQ
ncbi:hypothetical protein MGAST_07475 [Mycobacterium gastri 'Wayne']|nr:hypothetical protein MGAST_07475 [Mycobacterium gastri 'Wayne']